MANRENLPVIQSNLNDQILNTQRPVDLGRRILLLGTAARGPMNEPRVGVSPKDVEDIYGSISQGTLVRGYMEALSAPGGQKDIILCRIGNGTKASLDVPEMPGSGVTKESTDDNGDAWAAMSVEALDPGAIYNSASLRQEVVNGQLSVVFYNPVTELETVIPYDPTGLVDNSVADVQELVNALNLDSNFSAAAEANVNYLTATMTLTLKNTDAYVTSSGNYSYPSGVIEVDLPALLEAADTDGDDLTEDTAIVTVDTPVTAGNKIYAITSAHALVDQQVDLDCGGKKMHLLTDPVQTTGGVADDFLHLDLSADADADGQGQHVITSAFIGTGDGTKVAFSFSAYEPISTATAVIKRTGPSGAEVTIDAADYTWTSVGGDVNNNTATVTFDTAIPSGHVVTLTGVSEIFNLTKVTTLTALNAATSYRTYFAAGKRLYFGAAQPYDLRIAYKAKKEFTVGRDIALASAALGLIDFPNLTRLPDIWNVAGADVVLVFQYLPEWPSLASARSLSGGTNGIVMTGAEKYAALETAYTALENTPRNITVPVSTYIDDTKVDYDAETGVEITVNAGFAEQLAAACADLLDGVSECYGVIATKPITPADGRSVKTSDITTWIEKLTIFSNSDTTRAANVMKNMDSKHLRVVAFEPIFFNNRIQFPYTGTGECVYAGLKAKLPSNKAATMKSLSGIVGLRYLLSSRQLNTLAGARYIVAHNEPGIGFVITSDVTAAATTSQWTRSMTFDIITEVMEGVRRIMRPFQGNGFGPAQQNAADTAIMNYLNSMQNPDNQKLVDGSHIIQEGPSALNNHTGRVRLILQPIEELVKFVVDVDLRAAS